MTKKILAIIQARMNSTRLPGKMLKEIEGKPLLWYIINAAKQSELIDEVVLATTKNEEDKELLEKAEEYCIKSFAGSENDVLDRYYQTAKKFQGDIIVRLTGDCPLADPNIIDKVIEKYKKREVDYCSNVHPPTFPDGFDVEVFGFDILEKLWKEVKEAYIREHVVAYIREHPKKFKIFNVENEENLSNLRFTVDNTEDLELIKKVIEELGEKRNLKNLMRLIKEKPEILKINEKYKRYDNFLDEGKKIKKSKELLEKAKKIIPSASQTYSKSYNYFCEGVSPAFLERGEGSHVWDVDGNEYIDFVCALGPVTIGYNDARVNNTIKKELEKGISFSLPTELEVKLAEKIIEIIPCAEMAKFMKNGSDVTTAAIRLARAYTQKDMVACCGYHGCQDWYVGTTNNDLGVPKEVKKLTKTFEYNNIESLKKIFEENKGKVAAVILEPCQENGPKNNFLEEVKKIASENKAVLIFDEVVSGFRMSLGGAQEYFKITPDLGCFGKGVGNGASISFLTGKKEIMELIDKGAFISTTFGGETIGLAAALEVIKILEKPESFKKIWRLGNLWKENVERLIEEKNMKEIVEIYGLAPHCGVIFKDIGNLKALDLLSIYQQTLTENKILSTGINNFCLAHSEKDINKFVEAVNKAFNKVKEAVEKDSVEKILKGEKIQPVFNRFN